MNVCVNVYECNSSYQCEEEISMRTFNRIPQYYGTPPLCVQQYYCAESTPQYVPSCLGCQKAFKHHLSSEVMSEKPLDLIHGTLDKEISVQLKDGREIVGILKGYDLDFNLTIDKATIMGEGGKKGLGKIVLRHNNVTSLKPL